MQTCPIVLNNQSLPYVSSGKHLGNILDSGVKNKDLQIKRGLTMGKLNGILQEFYFAHPSTKCSIMHKYCTRFYGCELWDKFCEDFSRLLATWTRNTAGTEENPTRQQTLSFRTSRLDGNERLANICIPYLLSLTI